MTRRQGDMIPQAYRELLRDRRARRLLAGLGVSSLGDGMSTVTIAWLAVQTPRRRAWPVRRARVVAYTLPGAVGALAITLLVVAGWGACLVPFAFAPSAVTLVCFAMGGVIHGPFVPLTYALLQSITTTENLPSVLAARSGGLIVATPLGTAIGGPIVASLAPARCSPLPAPRPSSWRRSQRWSGNETRVKRLARWATKPIRNQEARSPSRT